MKKRRKNYEFFERQPGDPAPITASVTHKLQFHEMDPANIAWHGQYPAFFEQAQAAIGELCSLNYPSLRAHGLIAPIRKFHAEYFQPLNFGDVFTVTAILLWSEGARVNMEYIIRKSDGSVAGAGYTVQLFMDAVSQEALLVDPDFWSDFKERWRKGEFNQ